jgi:3-oxoacyl-[acyl-carrier protein] reductase
MDKLLQNKTAIVTGAGRGIGRCISGALADAGARVVLTARTRPQIEETAARIRDNGGDAAAICADLTKENDIRDLFRSMDKLSDHLDVLVNNAGIGTFGPVRDFPVNDWDRIMSVNARGTFLCCQEAMKRMVPRKSGYIINIASVVGFKGYINQSAYGASKHAIMGLTKTLAIEAQEHNIRVSAILPGGVDTGLIGDARPDLDRSSLMQPEDIAQTVLYLLSLSDRAAIDQIYIRRKKSSPF